MLELDNLKLKNSQINPKKLHDYDFLTQNCIGRSHSSLSKRNNHNRYYILNINNTMKAFRRLSSLEKSCNRATVLLHHMINQQEWDFANRLLKDATKYKRSLRTSDTIASDFIIHHAC